MSLVRDFSREEYVLKGPGSDPVDHFRTTRQHAGESMANGANAPGLVLVALGIVALVVGLFGLATRQADVGLVAVILAVVTAAVGGVWISVAHRRVRKAESNWAAEHSDHAHTPPNS
jgi:protein-S-isoprenylcysteine O-methyltransferase Ste14